MWRDVQRLPNTEVLSKPALAKLAIDHASEKGLRALRVTLAAVTIGNIRKKAASNKRISAEDLDHALFSMIITANYLSAMGEDRLGYVELLARGDSAKAGSSKGGACTPSDEWKSPAKAIFETLWAAGERHKSAKAWANRIRKEAERLQMGSTASWPNTMLPIAVGDWKVGKGVPRRRRNKRTSAS